MGFFKKIFRKRAVNRKELRRFVEVEYHVSEHDAMYNQLLKELKL